MSNSCRTATTVRPSARHRAIKAKRSSIVAASIAPKGSSRRIDRLILDDQPREQRPLHLSPGQGFERPRFEADKSDRFDRRAHPNLLGRVQRSEKTDARQSAHGHEIAHIDRKSAVNVDDLRQIGDGARRQAAEMDFAAKRRQQPGERLEQRRLAGAVRAADGESFSRGDFALEVMNRGATIITEGEIDEPDRRRIGRRAQCSAQ